MTAKQDKRANFLEQYAAAAEPIDSALVDDWGADLDSLLIFSGLFSAVLTAFLVESYKLLQPDFAQLTYYALTNSAAPPPYTPETFVASGQARTVNCLWVSSLIASLFTALITILAKQWLKAYPALRKYPDDLHDWVLVRQFRHDSMFRWRVPVIIALLPVIVHISLLLFLAGLVVFLVPIDATTAYLALALSSASALVYVAAIVSPLIWPSSPFRSMLLPVVQHAYLSLIMSLRLPERFMPTRWRSDPWFSVRRNGVPVQTQDQCFTAALAWLTVISPGSMDSVVDVLDESLRTSGFTAITPRLSGRLVIAIGSAFSGATTERPSPSNLSTYLRVARNTVPQENMLALLEGAQLPAWLERSLLNSVAVLSEVIHELVACLLALPVEHARFVLSQWLSDRTDISHDVGGVHSGPMYLDSLVLTMLGETQENDVSSRVYLISTVLSLQSLGKSHGCWLRLATELDAYLGGELGQHLQTKDEFAELQGVIQRFYDDLGFTPCHPRSPTTTTST